MKLHKDPQDVLDFWFTELTSEDWFSGAADVDEKIERFRETHAKVAAGEYWRERGTPQAFLAEVIVLDQFSRNLFRSSGRSFAYDGQALTLSQTAINAGYDNELSATERMFLFMPFMHSESQSIHAEAVPLFESLGNEDTLKYEQIHKTSLTASVATRTVMSSWVGNLHQKKKHT